MTIDLIECARLLRENDGFIVLSHEHPDGDTLGGAFALMHMLKAMGKRCAFACADEVPADFSYIYDGLPNDAAVGDFVIAVDVADKKLLGSLCGVYGDKVDLCIDHHLSNTGYADYLCLEECAATCELIYRLCVLLEIPVDRYFAECIYTGISTDTGCFRYQNTTASTLRLAAELFEAGIDSAKINKLMFETKSKSLLALENLARETLEYHFNDECAIITLTREMYKQSGSNEHECYTITALPRQIEGVKVGAVIKEKQDGTFGISVRTDCGIDASVICKRLGGGGHKGAAGCTLDLPLEQVRQKLLEAVKCSLE